MFLKHISFVILLVLLLLSAKTPECPKDMILVDGFCIDKYEWPNKKGVKPLFTASGRAHPKDKDNPMDATRLCASVGKRVCGAYEWINACQGHHKTVYTWGNKKPVLYVGPDRIKQPCNFDKMFRKVDEMKVYKRDKKELKRLDQREPSGYRKECSSHDGVMDLIGNVEEWVEHPLDKKKMCLAGGHWSRLKACASLICGHDPKWYYYSTGFRCCKDL